MSTVFEIPTLGPPPLDAALSRIKTALLESRPAQKLSAVSHHRVAPSLPTADGRKLAKHENQRVAFGFGEKRWSELREKVRRFEVKP